MGGGGRGSLTKGVCQEDGCHADLTGLNTPPAQEDLRAPLQGKRGQRARWLAGWLAGWLLR
jgi:hypothetical protein